MTDDHPRRRRTDRLWWFFPTFYVLFVLSAVFVVALYLRDQQHRDRDSLIRAQVIACQRTNDLRRAVNDFHRATETFMIAAAQARENAGDEDVAKVYRDIAASLRVVIVPHCPSRVRLDLRRGSVTRLR